MITITFGLPTGFSDEKYNNVDEALVALNEAVDGDKFIFVDHQAIKKEDITSKLIEDSESIMIMDKIVGA